MGTTSAPVTFTFSVLPANVDLTNEHVDLRMEYAPASSNIFYMVASDEDHHIQYASNEVNLVLETNSQITLPGDFPPLGNAGDQLWVIPQSQDPTLLYLGISAEDVPLGVFNGNLTFQLKAMDGPGNFFLWQADSGGNLTYYMNTRDGITASDTTIPLIPSHSHYNWGFTTNGVYHLTFQAYGQRLGEATNIFTPLTTFTFNVLPFAGAASANSIPGVAGHLLASRNFGLHSGGRCRSGWRWNCEPHGIRFGLWTLTRRTPRACPRRFPS